MNHYLRITLLLLASGLIFSCSSVNVKVDYDEKFDFKRLRTYAWSEVEKEGSSSLVEERVKRYANLWLKEKGYQLTSTGEADALISYSYRAKESIQSKGVTTGVGLGIGTGGTFGGLGFGIGGGGSDYIAEGIMIDFYLPDGKTLIWRGLAHETLVADNPEDTNKNFERVIRGILAEFPPEK